MNLKEIIDSSSLICYFGHLKMKEIAFKALSAHPLNEARVQFLYGVVRTRPSMVPYVGRFFPLLVKNCGAISETKKSKHFYF